jgi:glutathione S-transferase
MLMTGQRQVPVLRLDGETISDSTRIIAALERRCPHPPLYPADAADRARALALEDFFDEELGPHIRRVFFHHLLADPGAAATHIAVGERPLTRTLYRAVFPAIGMVMRLDMGIDDAKSEQSRAKVAAAFDRLEAELQPSGYLVGNAFSVADLTAAALLSPLLQAPEFPYALPPFMPTLRDWCASFATRPGFVWAREMYRRHRGTSAERTS